MNKKKISIICMISCFFSLIINTSLPAAAAPMFELWNRLNESKKYQKATVTIVRASGVQTSPIYDIAYRDLISNGHLCLIPGIVTKLVVIVKVAPWTTQRKMPPGVYPQHGIAHAFYYTFPANKLVYLELKASGDKIILQPQGGFFSTKSKGGYSLTRNVSAKEIRISPLESWTEVTIVLSKIIDWRY